MDIARLEFIDAKPRSIEEELVDLRASLSDVFDPSTLVSLRACAVFLGWTTTRLRRTIARDKSFPVVAKLSKTDWRVGIEDFRAWLNSRSGSERKG